MFKLVLILSFIYVISSSDAAVSIEAPNPIAKQGTCLPSSYPIGPMKSGESKTVPKECTKALCYDNGSVEYQMCGVVGIPENCKFVEPDYNASYPECCPTKFTCD